MSSPDPNLTPRGIPKSTKIMGGVAVAALAAVGVLAVVAVNAIKSSETASPSPTPVVQSVKTTPAVSNTPLERVVSSPTATPLPSPNVEAPPLTVNEESDFYIISNQGGEMIEIGTSQNFVNYLASLGLIDQQQVERYDQEGGLQISIEELADETSDLIQKIGYEQIEELFGIKEEDAKYLVFLAETKDAEAQIKPTPTPKPTITPTRVSQKATIEVGSNNAYGTVEYSRHTGRGVNFRWADFINPPDLLDYLLKEGVITPAQRRTVARAEPITVLDDELSVAIYKLLQSRGKDQLIDQFGLDEMRLNVILYNFDESLLENDSAEYVTSSNDPSYNVVINSGSLETVVTDEHGNTTRVNIGTVAAEELLDYLLSQNKITIEQRNAYGQSQYLELSLQDIPDIIHWGIDSDKGVYLNIDKEGLDYLRNEILPILESN